MTARSLDDRWSAPDAARLRALAWALMAAQVAAVLALAALGRWEEWRILTCFVAPTLLFMLLPHRLPPAPVLLIVAATAVSGGAWAWNWYRVPGFDDVLHVLNPFAIAAPMMIQFRRGNLTPDPGSRAFVVRAAALSLLLALAWELFESTFLDLQPWDTVFDVLGGVVGGALGGLWARRLIARHGIGTER